MLYRQGILSGNSPAYEPGEGAGMVMSVFPNPVEGGGFWVKSESDVLQEISLFDVFGKKIFGQNPGKFGVNVPTDHLQKGVYFLKVKTQQGEASREIIVR